MADPTPTSPAAIAAAQAQEAAKVEAELAKNPRDETVPGGVYKMGDRLVNSEGQEVDKSGKAKQA